MARRIRTHAEWNVDTHIVRTTGPTSAADPLAHLGGGLVGERDGEDLLRAHTLVDEVRDAVREHPGLARARAGDHEQRAVLVDDGVELVGVQALRER